MGHLLGVVDRLFTPKADSDDGGRGDAEYDFIHLGDASTINVMDDKEGVRREGVGNIYSTVFLASVLMEATAMSRDVVLHPTISPLRPTP